MKIKISIILLFILTMNFFACDQDQEKRKIKLSNESLDTKPDRRLTSTIYLEPTLRRAIAIMFFENKTGDQNLEWLQKGITEMLIRSLSQSSSLSVLSTDRLFEILKQLGETSSPKEIDFDMAAIVAKEANVEAILTGNISQNGDSLKINVKVLEPNQGKILKEESVEGKGLEAIFSMVDDLSQKIKNALALSLEKQELARGIAELSTNSIEAWRYYSNGIDLFNKLMLHDALVQFEKAVEADSTFIAAYYRLCLLFIRQGEREKFYEYFPRLKALKTKATPKEQYQIDQLEGFVDRDLRKIIDASKRWVEQNPGDVEAHFNLGDIYFGLQNYDEALGYYKAILSIDPKYKSAYNMIGYCYARKGDIENAVATMKQYQELAPDESNPFDSMGEIYFNYGEYKLAEKNFKQSIKLNENFTGSWFQLGNVYLDQGEYQKASDIFHQFLEKVSDPSSKAIGYQQMGLTQWRLGEIDTAIDYFQRFVENRVGSYRAATWVSELYLEKDDSTEAVISLQKNYDFIRDSIVVKEPNYIRDLANLSLWFDVNPNESINIIKQTLEATKSPAVQMWGQFYLVLLYLKTNQLVEYQKISENFTSEFMEIMKDVRNVRFSNSTWKSYLIFNQYAYRFIDEGVDKYHQLIQYCMDHELIMPEMVFRLFLVDLYFHNGERGKALEQLKIIGAPEEQQWMVIAPFDNTNGFNKKYPPEREIKLNKIYKDQDLVMKWQHADDGFNEGYINLKQIYEHYNWKVAYGLIYIKSPDRKAAQIRIGTNESVKLWLNDEEVWRMNLGRDAVFDNDIISVTLKPGLNKILIKVCNLINEWGFYFRVTDEEGKGLPDIEFVAADQVDL